MSDKQQSPDKVTEPTLVTTNPETSESKSTSQSQIQQEVDEKKHDKAGDDAEEEDDDVIELNENAAVVPDFSDPTLEVYEVNKDDPPPEDDDDDDDADVRAALAEDQYGDDDYGFDTSNIELHEGGECKGDVTDPEQKSDAKLMFDAHTDAVYCVSFHPTNESLAASGGGDDTAYIFSLDDGKVIHKFSGYSDSVNDVAFNFDGSLLAVGILDGEIHVYDVTSGEEKQHFSIGTDLTSLAWHPKGNVLMAGAEDRNIWLWNCNSGETLAVLSGHSDAVQSVTFSADGTLILSGGADGKTIIWNPKARKPMFTFVQGAPLGTTPAAVQARGKKAAKEDIAPVLCLATHPAKPMFASGAEDGAVCVYSLSSGKPLFNLKSAHTQSVESMAFSPEVGVNSLLATGSVDGFARIWDLNKNCQQRHQLLHPHAVTKVAWHPSKLILFTTCNDNIVRIWDALSGRQLAEKKGHHDGVFALRVSSQGKSILTGSDDHTVLLFDVEDVVDKV